MATIMYSEARQCYLVLVPKEASWTGKKLHPQFKEELEALRYGAEVDLAIKNKEVAPRPVRKERVTSQEDPKNLTVDQRYWRNFWRGLLTEVWETRWKFQSDGATSQKRAESLIALFKYKNPKEVLADDLRKIRDKRLEKIKGDTFNKELSALSVIIKHGVAQGKIDTFPLLPFIPQRQVDQQKVRRVYIKDSLYEKVVNVIKTSSYAYTLDYFEFLFDVAARRSEVLKLRPSELDLDDHAVFFYAVKNGRDRSMNYSEHIHKMLLERLKRPEVTKANLVFPEMTKNRHQHAWNLVRSTLFEQGDIPEDYLQPNKFVPYGLRHGMATIILEQTSDVRLVQDCLGHKSINTTEIYTHISSKHKRNKLGR